MVNSWTTQDPCTHRKHEQEERQNGGWRDAEIEEQISFHLSDMQVDGEQSEKVSKPPFAFGNVAQQETRKGMQVLEQTVNQQVHEQNQRLWSLESLITENQKRTENSGSNGGSHPSDTTDAAEDRSDVPAVFVEGPRRYQREVETGHAVEQLMSEKKEHTQMHGPVKETEEHTQLQGPVKETKEQAQPQGGLEKRKSIPCCRNARHQKQGWRIVQQCGRKAHEVDKM